MATDLTDRQRLRSLDLTGLPEPVVEQVTRLVQEAREKQAQEAPSANGTHPALPPKNPLGLEQWEGAVLGTLSREEIYDDVG